jgi:ubiquitin-like 1-activating enzyme E1 B
MTFVAATSNLRAHAYGIEKKSQFEAKAMAGNIIPAIATTNAIIAGLIVIQAYKVLMGQLDKCKTTFVVPGGKRQHLFINEPLAPPNPDCYVCSVSHYSLSVDTTHFTLKNLRDRLSHRYQEILGNEFGSDDFQDISVSEGSRLLLDPDFDDNLGNTFESLGLSDGSTIQVSFEHPKLKTLNFIICHTELFTSLNKQDMIQRVKCPEHDEPAQNGDSKQVNGSSIQVEDDDDLIILEEETTTTNIPQVINDATKRPISPTSINSPKPQQPSKVQKTEN